MRIETHVIHRPDLDAYAHRMRERWDRTPRSTKTKAAAVLTAAALSLGVGAYELGQNNPEKRQVRIVAPVASGQPSVTPEAHPTIPEIRTLRQPLAAPVDIPAPETVLQSGYNQYDPTALHTEAVLETIAKREGKITSLETLQDAMNFAGFCITELWGIMDNDDSGKLDSNCSVPLANAAEIEHNDPGSYNLDEIKEKSQNSIVGMGVETAERSFMFRKALGLAHLDGEYEFSFRTFLVSPEQGEVTDTTIFKNSVGQELPNPLTLKNLSEVPAATGDVFGYPIAHQKYLFERQDFTMGLELKDNFMELYNKILDAYKDSPADQTAIQQQMDKALEDGSKGPLYSCTLYYHLTLGPVQENGKTLWMPLGIESSRHFKANCVNVPEFRYNNFYQDEHQQ